jgi:chemosensory pili system protein ChpC
MRRQTAATLHTLEIPIGGMSLLLPSATIAEVVSYAPLIPVPHSPDWVLGAIGWRTLAVPVISFELLNGARASPVMPSSKIVILYPLAGRADWEFVAFLSVAEPRARAVENAGLAVADVADLPNTPYIAAGLKANNRLLAIPDLEALKQAFYP